MTRSDCNSTFLGCSRVQQVLASQLPMIYRHRALLMFCPAVAWAEYSKIHALPPDGSDCRCTATAQILPIFHTVLMTVHSLNPMATISYGIWSDVRQRTSDGR